MTPLRERPTGRRLLRAVSGAVLGGGLLVGYLAVVGVQDIARALWAVPPRRIVSLLVVGVVPLVIWGVGLLLVFERLGWRLRMRTAVLLFSASGFLNAITPFGQAGGDPLAALVFRRHAGADFETSLAAIGGLNALNRVAALVLGLLGAGYLGSRVAGGGSLREAVALVAGLAIAVAVGLALGWQYRYWAIDFLAAGVPPLAGGVSRVVPRVQPPTRESLQSRGGRFVDAFERLASDPARLAVVFGLSIAGHLAVASALWVALSTLGFHAPLAVVVLLIPLAKVGGIAPTPGGLGSAEALLGTLLVSATGVEPVVAGAAVLLYRTSAVWLPSIFGGLVLGWFVVLGDAQGAAVRPRPKSPGEPTGDSTADRTTPTVPTVVVAGAASLAVLTAVALHRGHLVVEPTNVVVHVVRDAALVVLSFVLTLWLCRRVRRRWVP